MREIKFRAFYKGDIEEWEYNGNARMIYDIQNAYDGTGFDDPEGGFGWVSCFSDFMDDEKMSLMQYTGLKDKSGTEIYEGDILEGFGREDFRMQVLFKEPSFSVKWFDKSIKSIRQLPDGTEPMPHNINITSEVIGNIYENPELLKE